MRYCLFLSSTVNKAYSALTAFIQNMQVYVIKQRKAALKLLRRLQKIKRNSHPLSYLYSAWDILCGIWIGRVQHIYNLVKIVGVVTTYATIRMKLKLGNSGLKSSSEYD